MRFYVNSSILFRYTCVSLGTQADDKLVSTWLITDSYRNTMLTLFKACDLVCSD